MVSVLRTQTPTNAGVSLAEIEEAYRTGYPRFLAVAAMLCESSEDGREAVQEAFAQAIRSRGTYRGDAPLEAWLWRIVVNAARSATRRPRAVPVGEISEQGSAQERADDVISGLLAALPVRQRTVLFLRYYADLEYSTIADCLEMQVGTVGSTLSAALAALRRGMGKEGAK
jgi:RNA polymerase sigma-70 factor (ECF subfamily)